MMRRSLYIFSLIFLMHIDGSLAQENTFTHYFAASSVYNPAFAGDTRFAHIQTVNRIQPTVSQENILYNSVSYDQKLLNHHSGFGLNINQRSAEFDEKQIKGNYSYTLILNRFLFVKAGLGISWNVINTHALSLKFPDQYDDFGYTGNPTQEPSLNEKSNYPAFASGFIIYSNIWWFSAGIDKLNRPKHDFAGLEVREPLILSVNAGYLFPLDRDKKAKRYFDRSGGLNPYSSLGPVISLYKEGPFNVITMGINAFTKPVFWGVSYRYSGIYEKYLSDGVGSLNLLAGYRDQSFSVAYSYDFILNRTPTNFKGAHEISLIIYLFSIREDYKKHGLLPLPNQLMY